METDTNGFIRDSRRRVVKFLFSLRFVLSLLMLFMYASGIVTWKVSGMAAADAVNDLSNKMMTEIRNHIKTSLTSQLNVAETITTMNAGFFMDGSFSETDVSSFMKSFLTQLKSYSSYVTTVSMTNKDGHLHGVYTDHIGRNSGYWFSNTTNGTVFLYDYNTTKPYSHEGVSDSPRLMFVEDDYNSTKQVWYTVTDTDIPGNKAWTSIYIMGTQNPITMLSESTVTYTKDGLMGVTSIDMALGFAGELLRNVKLPEGYKAFVVDVKNCNIAGGIQAVIGTADDTPLLYCKTSTESFPMNETVECKNGDMVFVAVNETTVEYIATVNKFVETTFGSWDDVDGHSSAISLNGIGHFVSISAISKPNLKWCVVILLPQSIYLNDIVETGRWLLAMYISVLVIKAVLSSLIIYFFIAPLHRLAMELELLSEFKMDENHLVLSAWSEIRSLQLTFLTLLRQMNVIKSYMPQALFAGDLSDTDQSETIKSETAGGDSVTDQADSQTIAQRKNAVRTGLSIRSFDLRKHITVLSIRLSYNYNQDVTKLHSLHCDVLELISSCAQSNKGTMDQISSDILHVLWGRDSAVNFSNIPETIMQIQHAEVPAVLQAGAAVGSGFTGSAGGEHIRTVSTLTNCRKVADTLSLLAAEHPQQRFLTTRRIREHTETQYHWNIVDVCQFPGTSSMCVFQLAGRKATKSDQEWLYTVGVVDCALTVLDDIATCIAKGEHKKAVELCTITDATLFNMERQEVLQRLTEMAHGGCIPLSLNFGYTKSARLKYTTATEISSIAQH